MYGEHANHEPALFLMHTGKTISSRPSIGAWVAYGLGTENQNLPAYVVLDDPKGLPINGISNWQSAWLPPIYQGTRFRTQGAPVLNLEPRPEIPTALVEAERERVAQAGRRCIGCSGRISRIWMRGFRAMNWPRGCRWRLPTRWM